MKNNNFSIIAGKYRRLQFPFDGDIHLRPTPHKVRETLFNWLQFDIHNTVVLDPFAGSGALGFEALSRGASKVVLVEKNSHTYHIINSNIHILNTQDIRLILGDFFHQQFDSPFDIIVLDPPFNLGLIDKAIDFIIQNKLMHSQTLLYIESEFEFTNDAFEIIKQKKSASVHYCLIKLKQP